MRLDACRGWGRWAEVGGGLALGSELSVGALTESSSAREAETNLVCSESDRLPASTLWPPNRPNAGEDSP